MVDKPTIILLSGTPASGKDTVTEKLHQINTSVELFKKHKFGVGGKKDNTYIGMAKVQVTTLLDSDLHFQMKRRGLKFTDAIRLGSIKMMQMEDGGGDKAMNENINKSKIRAKSENNLLDIKLNDYNYL